MNTEILKDNDSLMLFIAQLVANGTTQFASYKSEDGWEVSYKLVEDSEEPTVA